MYVLYIVFSMPPKNKERVRENHGERRPLAQLTTHARSPGQKKTLGTCTTNRRAELSAAAGNAGATAHACPDFSPSSSLPLSKSTVSRLSQAHTTWDRREEWPHPNRCGSSHSLSLARSLPTHAPASCCSKRKRRPPCRFRDPSTRSDSSRPRPTAKTR